MLEVTVGKDLSSRIIGAFPYTPLPSQVITPVIARPEKNAAISIPFSLSFSILDPLFPSEHKTCDNLCHSFLDNLPSASLRGEQGTIADILRAPLRAALDS